MEQGVLCLTVCSKTMIVVYTAECAVFSGDNSSAAKGGPKHLRKMSTASQLTLTQCT